MQITLYANVSEQDADQLIEFLQEWARTHGDPDGVAYFRKEGEYDQEAPVGVPV